MIPPLTILLPVLFLGSIVSTIAGGGLGIILTIAALFFTDVRTSVILVSLLGFVIQGAKIVHFRRYARWGIVRWYLLLGIPMSFLGGFLLFIFSERLIEISIAVLCLAFCALELSPRRVRVTPKKSTLIGLGAVNGIVGGVTGNGALLRSPALLAFGLSKEEFVGTSSMIAIFMNIGKTSMYVTQFDWTWGVIILIIAAIPVVLCGVAIGKRLLRYVHPLLFERILLLIVFIGAIRLLFFA